MRFGILGTGMVGTTIGSRLVGRGYEVKLGSRSGTHEKAQAWVEQAGTLASQGTFAEAAVFGDMVFNCTAGAASLEALQAAGAESLRGKVLIDVANPLDFSRGMPPRLTVCNDDSLGSRSRAPFPRPGW